MHMQKIFVCAPGCIFVYHLHDEGAEDGLVATTGDGIPSCCVGLADCLLNRLTTNAGGTESTKYPGSLCENIDDALNHVAW